MHNRPKVLVVGTTADYIHWIRQCRPDRALFVTDAAERETAREPCPAPAEEILCDLSDGAKVLERLRQHLQRENIRLQGVISFDCESMSLTAEIADRFALPYPSALSIERCRNKLLSKVLWSAARLQTPRYRWVRSAKEAGNFFRKLGTPCVLKPVSGSGSELIFPCESVAACEQNFKKIRAGLGRRSTHRLYQPFSETPVILAEERVPGNEYSCDVLVDHDRVEIIRLTRKIPAHNEWFGTTLGYLLANPLPAEINETDLLVTIGQAAKALGIHRGVCMIDFILNGGQFVLLEMAPRPGGDCLPWLLRRAWGLDTLAQSLDFAGGGPFQIPPRTDASLFCGFRIFAHQSGILKRIDTTGLKNDPRVLEIHLRREPGDIVQMPPEDYGSRILGHIVMKPNPHDPGLQCREMHDQIEIEME